MILRNLGVRHGRQAFASPLLRSSSRTQYFSTEPTKPNSRIKTPKSSSEAVADLPEDYDHIRHVKEAVAATKEIITAAAKIFPDLSLGNSRRKAPEAPAFSYPNAQRAAAEARRKAVAEIPENFRELQFQKKTTQSLGATLQGAYSPNDVLANPPHDASLEALMAAQVHMGHNKALWNPANGRYIYGERDGIHIISLETTQAHLRRAARVVEEVAYHAGLILFAGTRPGHMPIVVRAAELAGACHLFQKWTPGTITNRDTLLGSGGLQIVDEKDRPLPGFEKHLIDRRAVIPDLVVCLNPLENYTLLKECGMANIPTIGIIDTDADPTWVTYQIPANDDSLRSVALIAGVLGRAGQRGQQRRHADADTGVIAWKTPADIAKFIKKDYKEKVVEMEKSLANDKETKGSEVMSSALDSVREELRADL